VRFAQRRALGRKVSDEFVVPLCRSHHRDLRRSAVNTCGGGIDPLKIARALWKKMRSTREAKTGEQRPDGTATAAAVTTAATAARAGHPGSDAAASLENPEAHRQ